MQIENTKYAQTTYQSAALHHGYRGQIVQFDEDGDPNGLHHFLRNLIILGALEAIEMDEIELVEFAQDLVGAIVQGHHETYSWEWEDEGELKRIGSIVKGLIMSEILDNEQVIHQVAKDAARRQTRTGTGSSGLDIVPIED